MPLVFRRSSCGPPGLPAPQSLLALSNPSVAEGNSGTTTLRFVLSRQADGAPRIAFDYATSDGTATAGVDYVAASGSGTISAGGSVNLDVTVNGDTTVEPDETVIMTVSNIRYG